MPFLSHSVGPRDSAIAVRLRAVAAIYDIALNLPERGERPRSAPTVGNLKKIDRTDVVIGLVTQEAAGGGEVLGELSYAVKQGKPVVLLVEKGMRLKAPPGVVVVTFDREEPTNHEHQLMAAVKQIQSKQQRNQVFWIAGIALGLLGLAAVIGAVSDE